MDIIYALFSISFIIITLFGGSLYFHHSNKNFLKITIILDLFILILFTILKTMFL